jgi:hypothetical protein
MTRNPKLKSDLLQLMIAVVFLPILAGCSTGVDPSVTMGTAEFHITDAAVDDASVRSVFVTITDLRVDGNSISNFTKQTVDLNALREGKIQQLGTFASIAKSYNSITLVIDTNVDAGGGSPGAYVQTIDDTKYPLRQGGTMEITINKRWAVPPNATSTIVIDFDLRKAIIAASDPAVKYSFANDTNLSGAVRVVTKESTSAIVGAYSEQIPTGADKIIAYAYKRGTFDPVTETQAQSNESISFGSAVTSSTVNIDGLYNSYRLSFLEAGDYEIHFAAYKRSASSGQFAFTGMLQASTTFRGTVVDAIAMQPGINATVSSLITGL